MLAARRQMLDELKQKSSGEVLETLQATWGAEKSEATTTKRQLAALALGQSLQKENDESNLQTYKAISNLLSDPATPVEQRMELVGVLGMAQTVGAVAILLNLCTATADAEIRSKAIKAVSQIDEVRFNGRFREELTPLLEQAWRQAAGVEPEYDVALTLALARVGAERGVTLLVAEACAGSASVEDMAHNKTQRSTAALEALRQVRNPVAIPLLQELLKQSAPRSALEYVAGSTLAAMGKPDATQVLLQWSMAAGDEGAQNAGKWFSMVRDPTSLALVQDALAAPDRLPFLSGNVRSAVADAIQSHD
jgi:hypothetical protein